MVNIKDISSTNIGNLVIDTVSISMLQNTRGNYDLSDYVRDFDGTSEELDIDLIKLASKELQNKP